MKINKVDSNEKHQIKNRRKGIKTMLAISASVVGAGAGIGIGYAI
jgi:hypothetical protein